MSAINLVTAAKGRFMTRSNRLVDIQGSEIITEPKQGGGIQKVTVFHGLLYKMDGKTVDSKHRWGANGAFLQRNGVSSNYDLCQTISLENPPAEPTAEPTIPKVDPLAPESVSNENGSSESVASEYSSLLEILNARAIEGDRHPIGTLTRILAEFDAFHHNHLHQPKTKRAAASKPASKKAAKKGR